MHEDTFHLGIKGLIRNNSGRILLLRVNPKRVDGKAYWDLPGGRVQKGVSVEDTLRREIKEEIGLQTIEVGKHLSMVLSTIRIPLPDGSTVGLILSIYECQIPSDVDLTLSGEHTERQWFTPAQAARRLAEKFPAVFCDFVAKFR